MPYIAPIYFHFALFKHTIILTYSCPVSDVADWCESSTTWRHIVEKFVLTFSCLRFLHKCASIVQRLYIRFWAHQTCDVSAPYIAPIYFQFAFFLAYNKCSIQALDTKFRMPIYPMLNQHSEPIQKCSIYTSTRHQISYAYLLHFKST